MLHDLLIGACSFILGSVVTVYGLYRLGERRKAQLPKES